MWTPEPYTYMSSWTAYRSSRCRSRGLGSHQETVIGQSPRLSGSWLAETNHSQIKVMWAVLAGGHTVCRHVWCSPRRPLSRTLNTLGQHGKELHNCSTHYICPFPYFSLIWTTSCRSVRNVDIRLVLENPPKPNALTLHQRSSCGERIHGPTDRIHRNTPCYSPVF